MNTDLPTVEDAVTLANNGFAVFPIYRHTIGRCLCPLGCDAPGKHPAITGWPTRASNRETAVRSMWSRPGLGNIGCVPRGHIVLDVDPRNGGNPPHALPDTMTVLSGRGDGGFHAWFKAPAGLRLDCSGQLAAGVDVKAGQGGYLVMPPSLHAATMEPYKCVVSPVAAEAPAWLVEAAQADSMTRADTQVKPVRRVAYAYLRDGLDAALAMAASYDALFDRAAVERHLRALNIPPGEVSGDEGNLNYFEFRLLMAGHAVHRDGVSLRMRCPVHNGESETSLRFAQGERGILAHCFGCQARLNDIAGALNVKPSIFYYQVDAVVLELAEYFLAACTTEQKAQHE